MNLQKILPNPDIWNLTLLLALNYTNKMKDLKILFESNGIKSHNIIKPAA